MKNLILLVFSYAVIIYNGNSKVNQVLIESVRYTPDEDAKFSESGLVTIVT